LVTPFSLNTSSPLKTTFNIFKEENKITCDECTNEKIRNESEKEQ
jgi:hypothetical protein